MNKFHLDTEYTNGNLYRGDVFEIAVLSDRSGNMFHSFISIPTEIPPFVKKMCRITDEKLQLQALPFHRVMNDLFKFFEEEEESTTTIPSLIITHGGVDISLLIINCMKNNYDYDRFANLFLVDSQKIMHSEGYVNVGLDTFSEDGTEQRHSAAEDVKILQRAVNMTIVDVLPTHHLLSSLDDILTNIDRKLPINIPELFLMTEQMTSELDLAAELYKYANNKSAMRRGQIYRIASYYFKMKNSI